jgi:two-component system, response regulator PdtaR
VPTQIVIIVAEDEILTRMAIADFLRDEGFDVREAGRADEAMGILRGDAPGIHVLFTDVQMPGAMDGLALAHHTKKNWPWIALLIVSGRGKPDHAAMPADSRFLAKPYNHWQVVQHIQEMTDA